MAKRDDLKLVDNGLMTLSEAASYTSRSYSTLKVLLRNGELPYVRFGSTRLIPKNALDEYLAARLVRKSG